MLEIEPRHIRSSTSTRFRPVVDCRPDVTQQDVDGVLTLSDELVASVMGHLTRAERVTLAGSHPQFRRVLYVTQATALWGGALKLELSSSAAEGGGWYNRQTCNCCGVSFLDCQQMQPCSSYDSGCRNVFCQSCIDSHAMHDEAPNCKRVGGCRCCSSHLSNQLRTMHIKHMQATFGGDHTTAESLRERMLGRPGIVTRLTDRWLCSLPIHMRRKITYVVTRLVVNGARDDHSALSSGWDVMPGMAKVYPTCPGSFAVGLGALLQGSAPAMQPTWPVLTSLSVGEYETFDEKLHEYYHTLFDYIWGEQLYRLGDAMPNITTLQVGSAHGHVHEDENNVISWSFSKAVEAFMCLEGTIFNSIYDEPSNGLNARGVSQLKRVYVGGETTSMHPFPQYTSPPSPQDLGTWFSQSWPSLQIMRLDLVGCKIEPFKAAEMISQACLGLTHLFLFDEESTVRRKLSNRREKKYRGDRTSRTKLDFCDHLRSLQGHPNLKELHILIEAGQVDGYGSADGIDWGDCADPTECLLEHQSQQGPVSKFQLDDLAGGCHSTAHVTAVEQEQLLAAQLMLWTRILHDAQTAAGEVAVHIQPVRYACTLAVRRQYLSIAKEFAAKYSLAPWLSASMLHTAVDSLPVQMVATRFDRSCLSEIEMPVQAASPFEYFWNLRFHGTHVDESPPVVVNASDTRLAELEIAAETAWANSDQGIVAVAEAKAKAELAAIDARILKSKSTTAVTEDLKAQRDQCAECISELERAHAACIPDGNDPVQMVGPYTPTHPGGQYVKVRSPFLSEADLTMLAIRLTPAPELEGLAEEAAHEMRRRHGGAMADQALSSIDRLIARAIQADPAGQCAELQRTLAELTTGLSPLAAPAAAFDGGDGN